MSNKYGQALVAPITQTILPVMTKDGLVKGWYPIASHTFSGSETSYTIPDGTNGGAGISVPVTTVTKDKGMEGVQQYMAAVWPSGLAANYFPWASPSLVKPDAGYYRWYSLPVETWMLHFGYGTLLESLHTRMNISAVVPSNPSAPTVTTPLALTWNASVEYDTINGDCDFFDFNWIALFKTQTTSMDPLRIVVNSVPSGSPPPFGAQVIGIPQATAYGMVYDTIRIMKLGELAPGGPYAFTFTVYDSLGQTAAVTMNLTVN